MDDDIDVLSTSQSPSPGPQEIPISAAPQATEVPDQQSADEFDDNDFEFDGVDEVEDKETEAGGIRCLGTGCKVECLTFRTIFIHT